jgi:chaperonin cofactor prefoldin
MPKLAPDGSDVDNINKKIEHLELEQSHLVKNIRMTTDQLDGFTNQLSEMSHQDGPLDEIIN